MHRMPQGRRWMDDDNGHGDYRGPNRVGRTRGRGNSARSGADSPESERGTYNTLSMTDRQGSAAS